jgi:hypothetical protein
LSFKRIRDLETVGVRNNGLCQPQPPVIKSEAQVKREREDLWNQITQEVESSGAKANQIIVR